MHKKDLADTDGVHSERGFFWLLGSFALKWTQAIGMSVSTVTVQKRAQNRSGQSELTWKHLQAK